MNMHPIDDVLNGYADGSLDAVDRATVEAHLASCAVCRQTVDDLREILGAASALEFRDPPVRSWTRIERAIALDRSAGAPLRATTTGLLWLAAAAAIVLATLVGLRFAPARSVAPAPQRAASRAGLPADDAAEAIEELRQAQTHYENAIRGLEQIADAEQTSLDPQTIAALRKNFAVIDQAINESRAAVRSQPASEPAQQSLIENFKTKIALLQDTVALINEMRKGNEAGAARIVSGLEQKGN